MPIEVQQYRSENTAKSVDFFELPFISLQFKHLPQQGNTRSSSKPGIIKTQSSMPPKKLSSLRDISIDSVSTSRRGFQHSRDLVTRSQAALSSQATVQTQRTVSSLTQNIGSIADDYEFNREQMGGEVFITKEEETIIQQILEISRKGKINQNNAFEIPLKVMHTQLTDSANNKFWKFASELLSASMSIYDKRVENMYISTSSMQSRLTRVNINIKNRRNQEESEDADDVMQAEERMNSRENQERIDLLNISVNDFRGRLDLNSDHLGLSTMEMKDKITVKNFESKMMTDPIFLKTQKMFDSYSLKSLMVNAFPLGRNLEIKLFNEKISKEEHLLRSKSQAEEIALHRHSQMERQVVDGNLNIGSQQKEGRPKNQGDLEGDLTHLEDLETAEQIPTDQVRHDEANLVSSRSRSSLEPISVEHEKFLKGSSFVLKSTDLFQDIENFIKKQPQMKFDYSQRQNLNILNREEEPKQLDYSQVMQKERQFYEYLYNDIDQLDEDPEHSFQFAQIEGVDASLNEIHSLPTQQLNSFNEDSFMGSVNRNHLSESLEQRQLSNPFASDSCFLTFQENSLQNQPIDPWEIEFKNQKIVKKKKVKQNKNKTNTEKKVRKNEPHKIDFDLQITKDLEKVLKKVRIPYVKRQKISEKHDRNVTAIQFEAHMLFRNAQFKRSQLSLAQNSSKLERNFSASRDLGDFGADFFGKQFSQPLQNQKLEIEPPGLNEGMVSNNIESHEGFLFSSQNQNSELIGSQMGVNNIREIKKFVSNEVMEKGRASISQMLKLLPLSEAQMFTIFLHLVNEHNFIIEHVDLDEETDVELRVQRRQN